MEQGAFLPFYEQHKETLYHYACTLTANAHQAEDALQTAWLSCLRQEQRYAPWDETWDMPAPTPGDPRPIVAVIQAMPEPYRRLLELKFLLEWSNKEIAKHLGLSQTAVSTRLNRGRKLLQERLREEGYDYESIPFRTKKEAGPKPGG